jgi:hypothetical protein
MSTLALQPRPEENSKKTPNNNIINAVNQK